MDAPSKPKILSVQRYPGENPQGSKPKILSVQKYEPQEAQKKTGLEGVGQDIIQGFSDVPSIAWQGLKSLPEEAVGAFNQFNMDPMRALGNMGTGVVNTGRGIADLPSNVMQYLNRKELASDKAANFFRRSPLDNTDVASQLMGVQGHQAGDIGIQSAAGYGAFGVAGESGSLGALGRVGARAGASGAYGASQGQNPITSAALGPVTEGMIKAPIAVAERGIQGLNQLRPSVALSRNASSKELADNLRSAEGTNTLLSDVIKSPGLKKNYENIAARTYGSGADNAFSDIESQVRGKGEKALAGISEKSPIKGEADEFIKDALINAKDIHTEKKNALYNDMYNIADSIDFSPDLSSFLNSVKKKGVDLKNDELLRTIPAAEKLFSNTNKYKDALGKEKFSNIVDEKGAPIGKGIEPVDLKTAKDLKSYLYSKGEDFLKSTVGAEKSIGRDYKKLSHVLGKDIQKSIENSGSEALKSSYSNAENNYKEDFLRFLDKDLKNEFNENAESEVITRNIVKPGKINDKYSRIKKIQDVLPEDQKYLLGNSYLKSAIEEDGLNINELAKKIKALGPRQFEALYPDKEVRQQLSDFVRLKKMNETPINRMANPNNGSKNLNAAILAMQSAMGMKGYAISGPVGGVVGLAIPSLAANAITKLMTSPKVREKVVKSIIKNQGGDKITELFLNKFKGYADQGARQVATPYAINQGRTGNGT